MFFSGGNICVDDGSLGVKSRAGLTIRASSCKKCSCVPFSQSHTEEKRVEVGVTVAVHQDSSPTGLNLPCCQFPFKAQTNRTNFFGRGFQDEPSALRHSLFQRRFWGFPLEIKENVPNIRRIFPEGSGDSEGTFSQSQRGWHLTRDSWDGEGQSIAAKVVKTAGGIDGSRNDQWREEGAREVTEEHKERILEKGVAFWSMRATVPLQASLRRTLRERSIRKFATKFLHVMGQKLSASHRSTQVVRFAITAFDSFILALQANIGDLHESLWGKMTTLFAEVQSDIRHSALPATKLYISWFRGCPIRTEWSIALALRDSGHQGQRRMYQTWLDITPPSHIIKEHV